MKRILTAIVLLLALPGAAQADELFTPITTHVLTIGAASSRMGTGVTDFVTQVRLVGSATAHFAVGVSTVTAVADDGKSVYLPAGEPMLLRVSPGDYIAVIQDSAGGTFYITEMSK